MAVRSVAVVVAALDEALNGRVQIPNGVALKLVATLDFQYEYNEMD